MADPGDSILRRCEEGHVFDTAKSDTCPVCGSPASRGAGSAANVADTPEEARAAGPVGGAPESPVTAKPGFVSRFLTDFPRSIGGMRGLAIGGAGLVVLLLVAVFAGRDGGDAPGSQGPSADSTTSPVPGPDVVSRDGTDDAGLPDQGNRFSPSTAEPYGTWEMFTPVPGSAPFRHVLEILPDGRYSVYAGPYSHSGRMTFTGRVYQLQSRTSAFQDGGAFSTPDPDTIVFNGRLGRSVWARVRQPSLFDLTDDDLRLPKDLPGVLRRMTKHIRDTWRDDAAPVGLAIERTRARTYEIKVSFMSPRDRTGLSVQWGRYHSSEFSMGGVTWFDKPLPGAFVDLPGAYAVLKNPAPLRRATLGYFSRGRGSGTYDRSSPASWMILPETGKSGLVNAAAVRR